MVVFEFSLPFDLTIDLSALADVLAATAVTAHALLRKRDVRGAIGWIGLAWLSPVVGPTLYYLFGINRVTRRAAKHAPRPAARDASHAPQAGRDVLRFPENIRAIARVGDRITGRTLVGGNAISVLRGGDEAYPAMLDAVRSARRSVALASYIFRADSIGSAFIDALRDARRRGVQVRVLVDGVGSGYFASGAVRELQQAGIAAARFMHDWRPWRMPFLNMRNHKKILVVDGTVGFTGGLNLGAENLRHSSDADRVSDVHFRVDGPVVSQLMLAFAEDWTFTTGETLEGDAWWVQLAAVGSAEARGIASGPDEDIGKIESVLAAAVAAARRRLRIVTPYFLPDQRLMSGVVLAALRGVEVEIVIPARSDHRLLDWAMRSHLGFFAVPETAVHLGSAPFDHSKLVTVDGLWSGVGSANWDVRSMRLNFEFLLESYDASTVAEIDRLIDGKISRAQRLTLRDLRERPLATRFRDAAARLLLPYL